MCAVLCVVYVSCAVCVVFVSCALCVLWIMYSIFCGLCVLCLYVVFFFKQAVFDSNFLRSTNSKIQEWKAQQGTKYDYSS